MRYHGGVQVARSLVFAADGIAAIASARGLHVVDAAARRPPVHHELEQVQDLAAVGGELWAATCRPRLVRFGAGGSLLDEQPLWGGEGVLRPTAVGAPAALWTAAPASVLVAAGAPIPVAPAIDVDTILPVSTMRWVACRRDRVQLRDPGTQRWSVTLGTGGRVVDGAILFDARAVVLVVASLDAGSSQLVVLNLHDGAIQHRVTLRGVDLVRFAPARGYALMRSDRRKLVLLDLRFARVLAEHREERDILDAAIDASGQAFMLRFGEGHEEIAIGSVRELLAATPSSPVLLPEADGVAAETTPATPSEPEPAAELGASPPASRGFYRGTRALGSPGLLAPRPERTAAPPDQTIAVLERYRALIAAIAGHAVARAWDEGRLSLPSENALPFRAEVAGLLGRASGRARAEVAETQAHVAEALAAVRAAESALVAPPPLALLADEFGLSPTARLVFLVVATPMLWGELARLYGILANDEARALVDELLVSEILAPHAAAHEIARELDRDAPLVRHGIVRVAAGKARPFAALSCDPITLRILRAADPEPELGMVRVVDRFRAFEELLIPGDVKDDLARRIAGAAPTTAGRVVITGRSGSGRHAVLAALAGAAGRWLGIIDAVAILRDARHQIGELRTALRRAHLVGLLPCVDGLETLPSDDPGARDLVRQVLDEHPGPLAVRLPRDVDPPLAPGYLQIQLPALTMEQRTESWQVLLAEHELRVRDPGELADRYRIGPAVIARVCARVVADQGPASADGEPADAGFALEQAIRQHLDTKLRATATRVERLATWSRVILPPDIQESVLELSARIKHRRTVFEAWGMGEIASTARGVTALFQGGPGTGKTLVASAIANELGMDLYRVDLSRVMSKWIGETEQNLAKLFDAAEDGNTIILFDEADSLFAKRTEVKSSVDRYANLEVNYLLQRLDSFEGIAILTTNFGTAIDAAFKRRLSLRLTFPFPDEEAREALWRTHLPAQLPRSGDFDLVELARKYQLSGGYIRNAALRAAFLAAEEHSPLTQDHLERAIKAEFREMGKIAESGVLE